MRRLRSALDICGMLAFGWHRQLERMNDHVLVNIADATDRENQMRSMSGDDLATKRCLGMLKLIKAIS